MSLLPEQISTYAADLDGLIITITIFVVGWFTVALVALLYGLFTNLKKEGGKASYIPGIGWDQTKWVLIPVILVTLCDFYIDIATSKVWTKIEIAPPQNEDVRVKATGTMWTWVFTYPGPDGQLDTDDDIVIEDGSSMDPNESNSTLVVPVNKTVVIDLASRDVLHSFFVREFRFKQDVIPGRTLTRWFQASKEGTYELACAEICGANHSYMRNYIKVVSQEEYENHIQTLYAENMALAN